MSYQTVSELTCPHCGMQNSITTANLPIGARLACSRCRSHIAQWRGADLGFEAPTFMPAEPDLTRIAAPLPVPA